MRRAQLNPLSEASCWSTISFVASKYLNTGVLQIISFNLDIALLCTCSSQFHSSSLCTNYLSGSAIVDNSGCITFEISCSYLVSVGVGILMIAATFQDQKQSLYQYKQVTNERNQGKLQLDFLYFQFKPQSSPL